MKICLLGNAQSPHIRRWATFFRDRGHEVAVISARPAEIEGVDIYTPRLPFDNWLRRRIPFDQDRTPNLAVYLSYLIIGFKIRRLVRRLSPDIVMAMTMETNGIFSLMAGHHPTALFHLGCKALSIQSETSLLMRALVKGMIRFSDMLYTGDSAGVKRLQQLGAQRSRIYVNPWGVEPEQIAREPEAAALRHKLKVSHKTLFVCVRVFLPEYDVRTFLQAIPNIVSADPSTHFILVGDGPLRDELTALVQALNIDQHVTFTGYLPYRELPTYLACADFYVDPVHFPLSSGRTWWGHRKQCSMDGTGYSITLLMSLANGTVPLVTQRAGLADIFDDRMQGLLLWKGGDAGDLTDKATKLLARPELCAELRRELQELAKSRFNWKANAAQLEGQYLDIIARSRTPVAAGKLRSHLSHHSQPHDQ